MKREQRGGCHCGAVRFEVTAEITTALACNCSMCEMRGFLHWIVSSDQFRLLQGAEVLTSYRFNTRVAEHLFCSVCGVCSYYVPRSHPDGYSVNARCLDDVEISALEIQPFDGRHWEQARSGLGSHA